MTIRKTLLTLLALICSVAVFAQDAKTKAIDLIKEGIALNDKGQFAQAIEKYDEAIKTDPENMEALYEKGLTLTASGKADEAISVLEKAAASNKVPGAYAMLANIYDDKKDHAKAIDYYQQGIKRFPQYAPLILNLSISYMRQKNFAEAEKQAIAVIKLAPKYASGHRVYAMATFGNNNNAASLLGWCSFLMVEPNTKRSAEAIAYIKHILNNGIKKNADGSTNMSLPLNGKDMAKQLAIQVAVAGSVADKKDLSPVDSLQLQLTSVFNVLSELGAKDAPSFHKKYMADYFGALAKSGNMPTFAHFITMTTNAAEDKVWLGAHPTEIKPLAIGQQRPNAILNDDDLKKAFRNVLYIDQHLCCARARSYRRPRC